MSCWAPQAPATAATARHPYRRRAIAAAAACAGAFSIPALTPADEDYFLFVRPGVPVGARLQLPEGYSGLVLERQQVEGDPAEAPTTRWVPTASFAELTYWNHDSVPARGDGTRRCLEWAQLAAQVCRGHGTGRWCAAHIAMERSVYCMGTLGPAMLLARTLF